MHIFHTKRFVIQIRIKHFVTKLACEQITLRCVHQSPSMPTVMVFTTAIHLFEHTRRNKQAFKVQTIFITVGSSESNIIKYYCQKS